MRSGQVLTGRYSLLEPVGYGGMSVVWRAHDRVLGRDVAVKVLAGPTGQSAPGGPDRADGQRAAGGPPTVAAPPGLADIRAEAQAAARLSHPHVASVFDYGEVCDDAGECVPFVVMELLRGRSLAELASAGPVDAPEAVRICAEVADGLAAAHAQGLVHRDVKPGNVMITQSGAKVFDFGIAAPIGAVDDVDPNAPVVGTLGYVAPERLVGAPVSPAVDVYALGLMLYRILTHQSPWPAVTPTEVINAHMFVEPADIPPIPGMPASVGDVYRRSVAKDPHDRPSAADMARVLSAAAATLGASPVDAGQSAGRDLAAVPGVGLPDGPSVRADRVEGALPRAGAEQRGRRRAVRTAALLGFAMLAVLLSAFIIVGPRNPGGDSGSGVTAPNGAPNAPTSPAARRPDSGGNPADGQPVAVTLPAGPAGSAPIPGTSPGSAPLGPPSGSPTSAPSVPGPGESVPAPTPTPDPTSEPVLTTQSFTSVGGTVVLACATTLPVVVSAVPAVGYTLGKPGPPGRGAASVTVTFKRKGGDIAMTGTCSGTTPLVTLAPHH